MSSVSCIILCAYVILGASVLSTTTAFQPPPGLSSRKAAVQHHKPLALFLRDHKHQSVEDNLSSTRLISNADNLLQVEGSDQTSRRLFMASALVAAGALVGGDEALGAQQEISDASLRWETSPINKRSGVTVFDAENAGYNLSFVTYLSRFLLNFDKECQRWWFSRSKELPRRAEAKEINRLRLKQFGSFSASVEVGLQEFEGPDGPRNLMKSLLKRYCTDDGIISQKREGREIKEARRQIALLFGLLGDKVQPVQEITNLLAAVDNGSITSVKMKKDVVLDGYAPGYEPPLVEFPAPQAGENYVTAAGRAVLEPTGKILRIDFVDRGVGYSLTTPPTVIVSPPSKEGGKAALAKVKVFQQGPNKGRLENIQLVDPGSGYTNDEGIQVQLSVPGEGHGAVLSPVLELRVDRIEITKEGSGYAVEKPLKIYVEPPPVTARINVNDTLTSQDANRAVSGKLERPVVAVAYPRAEKDSYTTFRREGDTSKIREFEDALAEEYDLDGSKQNRVSGTVSGSDSSLPRRPLWGGESSSSLLDLLPSGVGLQYDTRLNRYGLAVDTEFNNAYPRSMQPSSNRLLEQEFGPRGRSPIERDRELGLSTYLRLCVSGAVGASGVHLALTPLDVVKTKVQTNPVKYPTVGASFDRIFEEEGLSTFFTGWLPTLLGNFLNGFVLYSLTEFNRRHLIELAGAEASSLEIPIILVAAGAAAAVGACLLCPFEAVRIRQVAQPDFAPNAGGVLTRLVKEEGAASLFNAIPVFLARNLPYTMTKFLVFDLSTEWMYKAFPAANDDLQMSLIITLVGGVLGGTAAAVVSNPADAVISEIKKAKSVMTPQEAVNNMLESAGIASLFRGLPVRMVFYSLVASLQFFVYDGARFALGVGPDDFKLYLDVLGGALRENGGPV